MKVTLLNQSDYQRATWKNGLGFTDQIAIHPPTSDLRRGDFLWRISSARIERSSPFSPFLEHDRILVILEGGGVRLTHEFEGTSDDVELPCLEPYEFPGDVPTRCELLGDAVQDLSVFVNKGRAMAQVEVFKLQEPQELECMAETVFVVVARGIVSVAGTRALKGATLRLDLSEFQAVELRPEAPDTAVVAVQISNETS